MEPKELHYPNDDREICTVLVAGDLCPQGRVDSALREGSLSNPLAPIAPLVQKYDLSIVNLECPLTSKVTPLLKDGPHLLASPECARGIRSSGFQVASLANNHIMDMGGQGLESTLKTLRDAGIQSVGAGMNLDEAARPLVIEVKSRRVAILAFAENEFASAGSNTPGACPLDDLENILRIQQTRKEHDIVLVILHGGHEGYQLPSPNLVKRCRHYVRAGAQAVVCHHSHISTGFERVDGAPLYYGTGNLLFDWHHALPDSWYEGYMVGLEIHADGKVLSTIHPHRQARDAKDVHLMPPEDARRFQERMEGLSVILQDPEALAGEWKKFCSSARLEYLGRILGSNRVEELLWQMNVLRPDWVRRRLGTRMLNLIRCESHRDLLLEVLASEYNRVSKRS